MRRVYLDTSVAVHAVVPGGDPRARRWLGSDRQELWSSTLLRLELVRVLRRDGRDPALAAPLIDRTNLMSLDDEVVQIAEAIEPHAKSLDALHLATCLLLGGLMVVTHDRAMRQAAAQLGLETVDPLG